MSKSKKNVCIIGLGYIGLPTAVLISSCGYSVLGVDKKKNIIDSLNNGVPHFYEPNLDQLCSSVVNNGLLRASSEIIESDVYIICVPTPFKNNKQPDLSYVKNATEELSKYIKEGDLVILESTSPVGTTELIKEIINKERQDLDLNDNNSLDVNIAYCPERVMPGDILNELKKNDRIIGGISPLCSRRASEFYETFLMEDVLKQIHELLMTKLTENACRDVEIAFANELSVICDEIDIDVWELINLANKHPRINILNPGPGVGGHCIAVDPWFIVSKSPENSKLIQKAREVNKSKENWVINKVKEKVDEYLENFVRNNLQIFLLFFMDYLIKQTLMT